MSCATQSWLKLTTLRIATLCCVAMTVTDAIGQKPRGAVLSISTRPGASVYLNGRLAGIADPEGSCVMSGLKAISFQVRVSLDGYRDWTGTVALSFGEPRRINAELALIPPGSIDSDKSRAASVSRSLTVEEIVDLLRGSVSSKRVASLVRERGANFALTESIIEQIRKAGGDDALLLAIAKAKR